jgi:hypothetical protein
MQPTSLNISSITLNQGCILCITDAIEKVIKLPMDLKTGYIGNIGYNELKMINIYKKLWPELQIKITKVANGFSVFAKICEQLSDEFNKDRTAYLNIHKNYGGRDIEITVTHQLIDIYANMSIDKKLKYK